MLTVSSSDAYRTLGPRIRDQIKDGLAEMKKMFKNLQDLQAEACNKHPDKPTTKLVCEPPFMELEHRISQTPKAFQ